MKDKKKVFVIGLAILGIIFIVLAIFMLSKNNLNESNSDNKENNKEVEANFTKISTFNILSFKVLKDTPNEVNMTFELKNVSDEDIKDAVVKLVRENVNVVEG